MNKNQINENNIKINREIQKKNNILKINKYISII
jgi:hypothetical protein